MNDLARAAGKPAAAVLGGVAALALLWWLFGDRLKAALGSVGSAVNPTSDQNLAYRSVNAVGAAVSGRDGFALGSWIFDVLPPKSGATIESIRAKPADERTWYENVIAKISGG